MEAGVERLCGPEPRRLPSLTGTDAAELEEYLPPLPSRRRVVEQVREALSEMEKSADPVLLMLVAEWGEGKTSVYNAVVEPWARGRSGWALLETRAAAVLEYLRRLRGGEGDPTLRLLAAVLASALERAGLLERFGPPRPGGLRGWLDSVLSGLDARLLVFVDEFEDLVASAGEEELASIAAGLVGLLNGDYETVSARCRGEGCRPGGLHLVLSLTPPAYSRLMGLRDLATVAARLKRRVRIVWLRPLPRREALAFLESLARYSLGTGLEGLLEDHGLGNALAAATLGNMGAMVSVFRYLVSWARGRGGCRGVKRLTAPELLDALRGVSLSVGGAELPALNSEAFDRLVEGWEARLKLAGLPLEGGVRLLEELAARGAAGFEELERSTGLDADVVSKLASEANAYAEQSWLRRELGVRRLVYRVRLAARVEDAFKLLRAAEPEAVRVSPSLARDPRGWSPLEELVDSLVYSDPMGRQVVAVPSTVDEAVDLVADASPVELGRGEAEALAKLLWDRVFSRLAGEAEGEGLLLSPRVQRLVYVSPELGYLDFIASRPERLRLLRRVYTEAGATSLLAGAVAALAAAGLVEAVQHQASAARLEARLPSGGRARLLLYAVPGEATEAVAERLESQVNAAVLGGWRPHAALLVAHGGVEPRALRRLEALERRYFMKTLVLQLRSLVSRVKLQAIGLVLLDAAGGDLEQALQLAARLPGDRRLAENLGFDPLRLQQVLREAAEELEAPRRLERSLEAGVDGAPLVIRDPRLGYDVERPTDLAGALRYFLAAPASEASPREALEAAYEYLQRYIIPRRGGGEARGILSPDIERGEAGTLEKYMVLLAANGFLEKINGKARIDVLSPLERAVLKALEQLDARSEPVQAARIWSLLVDEASNPGTRRMILQALAYRGLIDLGGARRVDPERGRVRLRDTPSDAAELIEEARGLLERLRGSPEAAEWGLIAAAKARGVRGGSLEALASKAERLLSLARQALEAGSLAMSLRLAALARDALRYALEELLPLARSAAEEAARLRRGLEEAIEELEELRHAAEEMLAALAGSKVEVRVEGLERLREALRELERVAQLRMSEEELDRRLQEMLREARARNPRRPGELLPFYINGLGPGLRFNYKLWLAASSLERLGVARLTPEGPRLAGLQDELRGKLERLVEELRHAAEEAGDARRLAARLRERLTRSLGVELHVEAALAAAAAGQQLPASLSLDEALELAERLRRSILEARRPLVELEELTSRLEERLDQLHGLAAEARAWASSLEEEASRAEEAGLEAWAGRLREAALDLGEALRQAEEHLDRARSRAAEGAGDPAALAARLREALELLDSAAIILRDSLDRAKRLHAQLQEEARARLSMLEAEAEALEHALAAAGVEPPERPRAGGTLEALAALQRHLDTLRRLLEEKRLLTARELEAYRLVALERRRRGELLLRDAARLVAQSLGLGEREARRLLIALIEKGVLEPRL